MKATKIAILIGALGLSASAFATDGYFSHGYGMKSKGMAGVGIALPQDALAAATNPAGMVMIGDRLDLGLDYFRPVRDAEITGNGAGLNGSYDGNGKRDFLIPEFGYNKMLGWDMAVGVSVYGNGGMNTKYNTNPFGAFGATNPGGVNLEQLFIAPTFAMKLNKTNAVGVSLVYGYQRFSATGLEPFANALYSANPNNMTNKGTDKTNGWGVRIGWTGQVSDSVTLGATYASKIKGTFSSYSGLFAGGGSFDIPENYGVGIAVKATPALTIAADIRQINYGKVKAIADPLANLATGNAFGTSNGPGFGWRNMTVYKLGASYEYSKDLTLRAGYGFGRQPIPTSETLFNILAPGVVENTGTLGATWTLANKNELTVAYMHAFKKTVNGSGSIPPGAPPGGFGGGEANIRMYEDSLGIAYGIKF